MSAWSRRPERLISPKTSSCGCTRSCPTKCSYLSTLYPPDARADFDRAAAPASVKDAPARFADAFDYYQQAVSLLLEAGEVGGQARTALIIRAGSIGDAGDTAFDRGTARVQAARRALGLGVDPRFSDVPTGTTRDSR